MSEVGAIELPSFELHGVRFEWDVPQGLLLVSGMPTLALWIGSSLAGMMNGIQRMVGTERFNLGMTGGGRESIDGDWQVISAAESFEQGFANLASYAVTCGWGAWTLLSLDRVERKARFRVCNNWEAIYQKALGVAWGTNMTGGKFAGYCTRLFGVNCWTAQTSFQARGDGCDEFIVEPSSVTVEEQLERLLRTDHATRSDLAVALQRLEDENRERKRAEREAQERLTMIENLTSPILRVWDGVLALPILGALSSDRTANLMDRLLTEISRTHTKYAILDVTGVDVVDTHTADHLLKVARAVELLGARCIITGVQPAVAQTMVGLQADLSSIVTRATLRDGLKYCMSEGAVARR